MPTGGCEVQAEQPLDPSAYPVRFKPLLESDRTTLLGESSFGLPHVLDRWSIHVTQDVETVEAQWALKRMAEHGRICTHHGELNELAVPQG